MMSHPRPLICKRLISGTTRDGGWRQRDVISSSTTRVITRKWISPAKKISLIDTRMFSKIIWSRSNALSISAKLLLKVFI
jgi:hypothetical protein